MDNPNPTTDIINKRRQFIQRLENHEDVTKIDFTRDGFQTLFVEVRQGTGFHSAWQQRADELGYRVEHQCARLYRLDIE